VIPPRRQQAPVPRLGKPVDEPDSLSPSLNGYEPDDKSLGPHLYGARAGGHAEDPDRMELVEEVGGFVARRWKKKRKEVPPDRAPAFSGRPVGPFRQRRARSN
jgi:hypothetical protein